MWSVFPLPLYLLLLSPSLTLFCLKIFALAVSSAWNFFPPRSLLKCHFSKAFLIILFKIATYPTHILHPPFQLYFLHCSHHSLVQWHTKSAVGMGNLPWDPLIQRCIIHRKSENHHETHWKLACSLLVSSTGSSKQCYKVLLPTRVGSFH